MLWKYNGSPTPTGSSFTDVPPGHLFYNPIRWLVQENIASGYEGGTFGPTVPVSRQAFAQFLYKMAGSPPVSGESGFVDVPDGHPFGKAITWLSSNGIINGFEGNTFRPGTTVSRQVAASMIAKYDALPG